jgi:hypothetical protein
MNAARETTQAELAVIENDMSLLQSYWRLQIQADCPSSNGLRQMG